MEIPVIHVFTHDSIGVGEDGPTHQPVEQLASLRAIPGLIDIRPADANEVAEAWRVIMQLRHEPVALILTRQALPTLDRTRVRRRRRAGQGRLRPGRSARRASSPSHPARRRAARSRSASTALRAAHRGGHPAPRGEHAVVGAVRPPGRRRTGTGAPAPVTARVSVEQASTFGWERYVGPQGAVIGMRPSARRPRSRSCRRSSASPPRPSWPRPRSRSPAPRRDRIRVRARARSRQQWHLPMQPNTGAPIQVLGRFLGPVRRPRGTPDRRR